MNIYSKVEVQYTIVQMTREADDLFRKGRGAIYKSKDNEGSTMTYLERVCCRSI